MTKAYRYIVYASLLFLVLYLVRQDLVQVPEVRSPLFMLLSLPFLAAGFIGCALAWRRVLAGAGYPASKTECIASMGLSIFTKYVPGKVWMVLGRATYIAGNRGYPLAPLSSVSLNDQFIGLWTGLVLGALGLFLVDGVRLYGWLVLFAWIALSVAIFSPWLHRLAEVLGAAILRRPLRFPLLGVRAVIGVLPWFAGYWWVWSAAFYLFVRGLLPAEVAPAVALAFPLAASLGVAAVVAPGGLGVREGVMTAYLTLTGVPLADAATIAVASRFWFLTGEALFFVGGLVASRYDRRRRPAPSSEPDR